MEAKKTYGDFGSTKLEEFKLEDKSSVAGDQRKAAMERKARLAFEKDVFNEATAYQQKAQTRLSSAEDTKRETMRQQLADIYQRLLKQHGPYVKANFRMISYGMNE